MLRIEFDVELYLRFANSEVKETLNFDIENNAKDYEIEGIIDEMTQEWLMQNINIVSKIKSKTKIND